MVNKKEIIFVINKHSGTSYSDKIEKQIINTCNQLNYNCHLEFTKYKFHATEIASQAVTSSHPFIFVYGGDGTINEVAKSLINTPTAIGIIPAGSGNGLARHLKIPFNLQKVLNLLETYNVISIDTIKVNEHLSINVSGIGFDAHIATLFDYSKDRGFKTYSHLAFKGFRDFNEFEASITINNTKLSQKAFIIAIANSSQYGNNAIVAPNASVVDGLIDINTISKPPIVNIPTFVTKLFLGNINSSPYSETYKTKRVQISLDKPMPFHVDGESKKSAQLFEIELEPSSLRVIVPDKNL